MSRPKLVYFPIRGRAEGIRLSLVATGVAWDEEVVTAETLPKYKSEGVLAFNQVPLLQWEGQNLVQSDAIVRYILRRGGLYGLDAKADYWSDAITDGRNDLFNKFVPLIWPKPNPEGVKAFVQDVLPAWLDYFENIVKKNHTHGSHHVLGNTLSLADLNIFMIVEAFLIDGGGPSADKWPHLKGVYEHVATHNDSIKAYITSPTRYPGQKFF